MLQKKMNQQVSILTPPSSTFSTVESDGGSPNTAPASPELKQPKVSSYSPNHCSYYSDYLNKCEFNLILVNAAVKLLKLIYNQLDEHKIRFFIIEILRRSKTSIQSLQIACYYMTKLVDQKDIDLSDICPRKLFLSLVIISSKFNQDYNYSFKSWLKICGSKNNQGELSVKELREIEIKVLKSLNYELYLNANTYENWCNTLMIFSYDFISIQKIDPENKDRNVIQFDNDIESLNIKSNRWRKIFANLNLKVKRIVFRAYFNNNIGSKIFFVQPEVPSLFKRNFDLTCEGMMMNKRVKYVSA